jgi:hypothetical protein
MHAIQNPADASIHSGENGATNPSPTSETKIVTNSMARSDCHVDRPKWRRLIDRVRQNRRPKSWIRRKRFAREIDAAQICDNDEEYNRAKRAQSKSNQHPAKDAIIGIGRGCSHLFT